MKDTWGLLKIPGWAFRDPAVFQRQRCVLSVCALAMVNLEEWTFGLLLAFSRGFTQAIRTPAFNSIHHIILDLLEINLACFGLDLLGQVFLHASLV